MLCWTFFKGEGKVLLFIYWTTLLFTQTVLPTDPVVIGLVLLKEGTEVRGENLQSFVESNWTTLFSHLNKVTLIRYISAWSWSRTLVTVVRLMHYHCGNKHSLRTPCM